MGLYSNEMPTPNNNGFSFKIKQNMKQASVAEISKKNPKLVKICSQIPIDDENMKTIIKNNRPRELTKPSNIGGDGDVKVPISDPDPTPVPISDPDPTPVPISEPDPTPVPISEPDLTPVPISEPNPKPSSLINPTKVNTSAPIINATPTSSTQRPIQLK